MKRIYSLLIFTCSIFLAASLSVTAQDNFRHIKDSLLQLIPLREGTEKLEIYKQLCQLPIPFGQEEEYFKFSEELIEEAQKQKNLRFESDAKTDELIKLYNYNKRTELYEKVDAYLQFFSDNEEWKNYYLVYFILIESYIFEHRYEKAMREARLIYEQAKEQDYIPGIETATYLTGLVYKTTLRLDEAEMFFRETISLSNDSLSMFSNVKRRAREDLCHILLHKKEYSKAIESAEELYRIFSRYIQLNPAAIRNRQYFFLIYYRIKAEAYMGLNEPEQAEHFCRLTEEMLPDDPRAMSYIYYIRARISEQQMLYEKSIAEFDKSLLFYEQHHKVPSNVLMNKARVLCKMGRGDEAYPIYEYVVDINDTVAMEILNSQLDELRTLYEVDKHIAEKKRTHTYFLFSLAGCLLIAVAFGFRIHYSRIIEKKNRVMLRQIRELQTQYKQRDEQLLNMTFPENNDDNFHPENRKDKLCNALRNLMLKDKIYRNPDITRDELIRRLNTNKDLFIVAFKDCFGQSFSEYVNNMRITDAISLLENSDLSIDEISQKVGFGSVRTFQRQFHDKYNMSPKEYRNLA
jgi:AraC-like DNA-binding protein